MKKIILFLCISIIMPYAGKAQDTIHMLDMRLYNRYFVNEWVDSFYLDLAFQKYYVGTLHYIGGKYPNILQDAYQFNTDDTIQVYGIAAGLITWQDAHPDETYPNVDTTRAYATTFLRLYEADPDSLRHIGEELMVNLASTPIAYYLDMDLVEYGIDIDTPQVWLPPIPMYELFFSNPVTVADTFYVGRRYRKDHLKAMHFSLLGLSGIRPNPVKYRLHALDYPNVDGWRYVHRIVEYYPYIFPIVAPPDTTPAPGDTVTSGEVVLHPGNTLVLTPGDTLVVAGDTLVFTDSLFVTLGDTLVLPSGDTLVVNVGDTLVLGPGSSVVIGPDGSVTVSPGGTVVVNPGSGDPGVGIRPTDLVYRYTAVTPNPATHKAKVTSSFGIERVEAYDSQGRLVYDSHSGNQANKQSGHLTLDLDLAAWPRGTYLLRITTPAGPTTKKLIVQ